MCACMFVQRNSLPDDAALFIVWLEPYVGTAECVTRLVQFKIHLSSAFYFQGLSPGGQNAPQELFV